MQNKSNRISKLSKLSLILALGITILLPAEISAKTQSNKVPHSSNISQEDQRIIDLGYIPDEVIVKFKASVAGKDKRKKVVKANQFKEKYSKEIKQRKRQLAFADAAVYKLNDTNVSKAVNRLKNDPDVEVVMPNYVLTFFSVDDPHYVDGDQWALKNTLNGKDIQIEEAWDISTGGTSKIVAVLDTGVSYNHPDLVGNMWDGSNCVDENGNVLGGCIHGYDFVNDDLDPADDNGHGTHMVGVIGALGDNGIGITGVNQSARIMAVKVGNAYGAYDDIISGVQFAKENGADIINASFGGPNLAWDNYSGMRDAIEAFTDEGLFVSAAGNNNNNNDESGIFPSGFSLNGILSVTGSGRDDQYLQNLNWGESTVDIFAPGEDILSTYIQNRTTISIDVNNDVTKNTPWNIEGGKLFTNTGTYLPNTSASAITNEIDLSGNIDEDSAVIYFDAWCDSDLSGDYVQLFTRKNEEAWSSPLISSTEGVSEVNESLLNEISIYDSYLGAENKFGANIPATYLDATTQFKFEWTTDGGDVGGPYRGCYIENIEVSYLESGETGVGSGSFTEIPGSNTSTATAFTTGVAALVWNTHPSLTATQVKQIIMDSGDPINNVHPVNGDQLTVSGNRLNAYRALVLAEQVAAGQTDVFLYPTIRSTTSGGYWNNPSTWEGGVVPGSNDVVEIKGNVTLSSNETIQGLLVKNGATLKPQNSGSKPTYTLTINGDLASNGTIEDSYIASTNWGRLIIDIAGNLENKGVIENRDLDIEGHLINTGTFDPAMAITLEGDLKNTGSILTSITFLGASNQSIDSVNDLENIVINNDVDVQGDLTLTNYLTVYSGKTLTLDPTSTLTLTGSLQNDGVISGGDLYMTGGSQNFYGDGQYDLNQLVLAGSGIKSINKNKQINADLIVNPGVTLKATGRRQYHHINVTGNLVNDGVIQDINGYNYSRIRLYLQGDIDNNGAMTNYQTFANWDSVPGADSYEFQLTDTNDLWEPVQSNGTSLNKYIKSYLTQDRRWRWRSVTGGVPSAWSTDKHIN